MEEEGHMKYRELGYSGLKDAAGLFYFIYQSRTKYTERISLSPRKEGTK
ncbi:hypothetical protein [Paenibacillus radicis (ex Xue et al. 2023)]|uniref:Uncharacterized protein n=1 Tax=Paenibacillus radicis (ex Xue et al. 2023) TaxID=2972489 RepID=A0ABT1YRN3_9BACL|nr:hypothetical protein [Paenibacillus radicis (ex Xue et al. 2023)]MCR8635831.1 hypothetical protein [Paenibacillus radicis (ex Xue et al. 2023)]